MGAEQVRPKPEPLRPSNHHIYDAVITRLLELLDAEGAHFQSISRAVLVREGHILSQAPRTPWPLVLTRACLLAGGTVEAAAWPSVGMECLMASADLLDDLADHDAADLAQSYSDGMLLTVAAGLVALAGRSVLRAVEDGVTPEATIRLGHTLAQGFTRAVDGQAASLKGLVGSTDAVDAYQLSAAKSGPLGEMCTRLGAIAAGAEASVIDTLGQFGWYLAVSSQLLNDARDVLPSQIGRKSDVREGAPTIPLVFARSSGAPPNLEEAALAAWEQAERDRIASEGGIVITELFANADRAYAEQALASLAEAGYAVEALRTFLDGSYHDAC